MVTSGTCTSFRLSKPCNSTASPGIQSALASLQTVPHTASDTEEVRARELRADRDGIMYAAMAGFNPRAIVTESPGVNFFADWVRAQDPGRLGSVSVDRLRPTPKERAEAVRARLRPIADNADRVSGRTLVLLCGRLPTGPAGVCALPGGVPQP